jgi:NAD(P)H-dependent flavin oxidoreductase YrpB (nitropropane dioxygenase family)
MALPPLLRDRLRLPAIGAPLFIISNPDLLIAQCKAGIVGAFPSLNARPIALLDEWLHRVTEELAAWQRPGHRRGGRRRARKRACRAAATRICLGEGEGRGVERTCR